jgi:hypothetical protein
VKTVGKRVEPRILAQPSGEALKQAAAFNEMMQSAFIGGKTICCKKGVYRFKTHEEANAHQESYVADTMAYVNRLQREQHRLVMEGVGDEFKP